MEHPHVQLRSISAGRTEKPRGTSVHGRILIAAGILAVAAAAGCGPGRKVETRAKADPFQTWIRHYDFAALRDNPHFYTAEENARWLRDPRLFPELRKADLGDTVTFANVFSIIEEFYTAKPRTPTESDTQIAAELLTALLRSPGRSWDGPKLNALHMLRGQPPLAGRLVKDVVGLLGDKEPRQIRCAAAYAVAAMPCDTAEAAPLLRAMLAEARNVNDVPMARAAESALRAAGSVRKDPPKTP